MIKLKIYYCYIALINTYNNYYQRLIKIALIHMPKELSPLSMGQRKYLILEPTSIINSYVESHMIVEIHLTHLIMDITKI